MKEDSHSGACVKNASTLDAPCSLPRHSPGTRGNHESSSLSAYATAACHHLALCFHESEQKTHMSDDCDRLKVPSSPLSSCPRCFRAREGHAESPSRVTALSALHACAQTHQETDSESQQLVSVMPARRAYQYFSDQAKSWPATAETYYRPCAPHVPASCDAKSRGPACKCSKTLRWMLEAHHATWLMMRALGKQKRDAH